MVNINCTEKQAMLIEVALDTLSRMSCGQLREAIRGMEHMRGKTFPFMHGEIQERDKHLDALKKVIFPELHRNASYGVGSEEIGDAQVSYEMVKKLQNYRTKDMKEAGVLKHAPLHYSSEPLIEVTDG